MKLGHIESTGTGLKTFYSIKEDVVDDSEVQSERGGDGDLLSSRRSAKAQVSLDLDHVTQVEFGDLHEVLNDRTYPHKMYLREPAADSQRVAMTGIGSNIAKRWADNTAVPTKANFTSSATEFTTQDYIYIQDFTNDVSYQTATKEYMHFFFQFDLTTWLATYGLDYLHRLTLFLQDPLVYRGTSEFGYAISAYNVIGGNWTEIKRQNITIDVSNQQYAALRPCDGFTKWSDYLDTNLILFRMTNRQPRSSTGTLTQSLNYIELFINGYGVVQTNSFDLNWRDQFTGGGYTGTIRMQEL